MVIDVEEKRIPATGGKNAFLAVIMAATFYVNFGLLGNGDIGRVIVVQLLSCVTMLTVMKHGVLIDDRFR